MKKFGLSPIVAEQDIWEKLVITQKTKPMENIGDVLQFVTRWTTITPS